MTTIVVLMGLYVLAVFCLMVGTVYIGRTIDRDTGDE